MSGRVRDLQVDATGQRAYAAAGNGGVWYTEDAGITWRPIGGWASSPGRAGGVSTDMSCGCLLVSFGPTAADDYVLVGTGEERAENLVSAGAPVFPLVSGRGVLAGRGPATVDQLRVPYEVQTGIGAGLENCAITRLARDPARNTHAQVAANGDRVLAATSGGLYLGTRAPNGAGVSEWQWARVAGVDSLATATDAAGNTVPAPLWRCAVGGGARARQRPHLYRADRLWRRVERCDGRGRFLTLVTYAAPVGLTPIAGRLSLSSLVGTRLYILLSVGVIPAGSPNTSHEPYLYRIPDATLAAGPAQAVRVRGVPSALWGDSDAQREWDQALTVEQVAGVDRVWMGGSGIEPYAAPISAPRCSASTSMRPVPPHPRWWRHRACRALPRRRPAKAPTSPGWWGNNVHADVHCIRVVTRADGARHVWVGCDGGIYHSELGGRVNSFMSRAAGMSVLEGVALANHPSSSHFCVVGSQDNGSQVRSGDTVWEVIQLGDGGGQMFHPVRSEYIISQWTSGAWFSAPAAGFHSPLVRSNGGGIPPGGTTENGTASFYSGCDAVGPDAGLSRVAIGTNRVWISDDLGTATPNTWRVLPFSVGAPAATRDPRATNPESAANLAFGVYQPPPAAPPPPPPQPFPAFGNVEQLKWDGVNRLYAVYARGLVRFDHAGADTWQATVILPSAVAGAPNPANFRITDVAPAPAAGGRRRCYFTTLGDTNTTVATATDTLWFFEDADPAVAGSVPRFTATGLRLRLPPADPSPAVVAPAVGPLDPAHAVVMDPFELEALYVGTTGGVWRGVHDPVANTWAFTPFMNGLPVTCVADLRIGGRTGGAPAILRAATRSRGVWEVMLGANDEPPRTWLRMHLRDDRRVLPTPLVDPRQPSGTAVPPHSSPDIVVRPAPRPAGAAALRFPFAAGSSMGRWNSGSAALWTFQTAFRWHHPSIRPDGQWSDQLADLVRAFRAARGLGSASTIDAATWAAVVGGTRVNAARTVTAVATDPWAVFQRPWQTATTTETIATEADVLELVQPNSVVNGIWRVHREPLEVDVLLHHRDTRALPANDAYCTLYWRAAADVATLLALPATPFVPVHAWQGTAAIPPVTGWTNAGGVTRLAAPLDAFMPKAVTIPLDLSDPAIGGPFIALIAVCGSSAEAAPAPAGMPPSPTIVDLVQRWPRAALRIVELSGTRATVP